MFIRGAAVVLALAAIAACGAARDQLSISNVNGCIKRNCSDPNAQDYTSCEATCRTYGR